MRTILAAILANVPSLSATYMNQIFDTLNEVLSIDHRALLGKLTSSLPIKQENEQNRVGIAEGKLNYSKSSVIYDTNPVHAFCWEIRKISNRNLS